MVILAQLQVGTITRSMRRVGHSDEFDTMIMWRAGQYDEFEFDTVQ